MALIDVVKWDGTPNVFAYKFPEENLTTFTQLIVNESQEAVLFRKGKILQKFGAGKHTLSTENIPLLENLYGIPFGGKNPFTAEVWFVNKIMSLDVKWGTPSPIQLRDPEYKVMLPVRAHGQFGVQIADAESFLVKLVGTLPVFDKESLTGCFRGMLLTAVSTAIARKVVESKIGVLEIAAHLQPLSDLMKDEMSEEFGQYGVNLLNFFISSISVVEEDGAVKHLKNLLSKKAEMDVLGYTYQQERSFDVLGNAAQNEGMAGSVMGAGMGIGMGFGVGGAVGGMMQGVGQNIKEDKKDDDMVCPHCRAKISGPARFCPSCGKSTESPEVEKKIIRCDKCNNEIAADSKFCPFCGDLYNPCLGCGEDNDAQAVVCKKCGKPMPVCCSKCTAKVSGDVKFCPNCGEQIQKVCSNCGKLIKNGFKFCAECGIKIE